MAKKNKRLEIPEDLVEAIHYEPDSGKMFWKKSTRNGFVGRQAGYYDKGPKGYVRIRFAKILYLGHRIAWKKFYGSLPIDADIDHRNGNRHDNRIKNLRLATITQNRANSKKVSLSNNKYKGVSFQKNNKKWQASIKIHGKQIYLGLFNSPEEAHSAYIRAAEQHFGEFARAA